MSKRALITAAVSIGALAVIVLAAFAIIAFVRVSGFAHDESVQRVHTIGERCESQLHQAREHGPEEAWFLMAHGKCLKSLAKVEARAGVKYEP